jgi:tRNA(adenine34) deaminase
MTIQSDHTFMQIALEMAKQAADIGEVPVGAVIVQGDKIIAKAYNRVESKPSATEHAELIAIRDASITLNKWRLLDCTLYVTLEPCVMCAAAIRLARIPRVVYGAPDIRMGGLGSLIDLKSQKVFGGIPEVVLGVMAEESAALLKNFFKTRRN